jgi:hypothetical protein
MTCRAYFYSKRYRTGPINYVINRAPSSTMTQRCHAFHNIRAELAADT